MKTIRYIRHAEPALSVDVVVDITAVTLEEMQAPGFERRCTIMDTKGLTEDAVAQGLDFTKKIDLSYKGIIDTMKTALADEIVLLDFNKSEQAAVYERTSLIAVDDEEDEIDGIEGEDDVLNVLDNDTFDGDPATLEDVTLTELQNHTNGALTLNEDGSVDVAPDTPTGEYKLVYEIREKDNPFNYAIGTVTIGVLGLEELEAGEISGEAVDAGTIGVEWTAATGGKSPLSYQVQRAPDDDETPGSFTDVGDPTSELTFDDEDEFEPGAYFWYRVVVTDDNEDTSTSAPVRIFMPAEWGGLE